MSLSLTSISHLRDEILEIYQTNFNYTKTARILCERYSGIPGINHVRGLIGTEINYIKENYGEDIVNDLRKERQKFLDINRITNRDQRVIDRRENAIEKLLHSIRSDLQAIGKDLVIEQRYSQKKQDTDSVVLVHLSDLHAQELIDIPENKFDFTIAAKRLYQLAQKTKLIASAYGASKVVLCITGDLINSDRRIDEMLSNAANRSRAVVLLVHLLRQFLLDLRKDFYIDIFGVVGNEGRAKIEIGWSADAALDNYDSLVYWSLQSIFEAANDSGIYFHELQPNEALIQIHNETILAIHGHQIQLENQRAVQSLIGKYAATQGIKVSHIICGHIHSTYISDIASRNSSLCGGNAYSSSKLGYASKAAQNIHIIGKDFFDGVKCDLQNTDDVVGYDCLSEVWRMGARTLSQELNYQSSVPIRIA